jgi:hypothetical protein
MRMHPAQSPRASAPREAAERRVSSSKPGLTINTLVKDIMMADQANTTPGAFMRQSLFSAAAVVTTATAAGTPVPGSRLRTLASREGSIRNAG